MFEASELNLEYVPNSERTAPHYFVKNDTHKYVLPIAESVTMSDEKLLREIFNTQNKDDLVESILVQRRTLIDIYNDHVANPNFTLDLILRSHLLNNKDKSEKSVSNEDLHHEMLSIPDKEVSEFKEKSLNILKNSSSENELSVIEEILSNNGIEKAGDCTKFLAENFDVTSVYHLKHISDYEMTKIASYLQISLDDVKKSFKKIEKI